MVSWFPRLITNARDRTLAIFKNTYRILKTVVLFAWSIFVMLVDLFLWPVLLCYRVFTTIRDFLYQFRVVTWIDAAARFVLRTAFAAVNPVVYFWFAMAVSRFFVQLILDCILWIGISRMTYVLLLLSSMGTTRIAIHLFGEAVHAKGNAGMIAFWTGVFYLAMGVVIITDILHSSRSRSVAIHGFLYFSALKLHTNRREDTDSCFTVFALHGMCCLLIWVLELRHEMLKSASIPPSLWNPPARPRPTALC
jgi:hypothetical protein